MGRDAGKVGREESHRLALESSAFLWPRIRTSNDASLLQLQNNRGEVRYLSPPQDTPLWHSQTHHNALLPLNSLWGKSGPAGPSSRDQGTWEATGATLLKLSGWNPESMREG